MTNKPNLVWEEPPASTTQWDETAHLLRVNAGQWARISTGPRSSCQWLARSVRNGKDPWMPTGAYEVEARRMPGGSKDEYGVWVRYVKPEDRVKPVAAAAQSMLTYPPDVDTHLAVGEPDAPVTPPARRNTGGDRKAAQALEDEKQEPLAEYEAQMGDFATVDLPVATTPAVEDALLEEGEHPFALAVDRNLRKKQVSRLHRLANRLGVRITTVSRDGVLLVTVAHDSGSNG